MVGWQASTWPSEKWKIHGTKASILRIWAVVERRTRK